MCDLSLEERGENEGFEGKRGVNLMNWNLSIVVVGIGLLYIVKIVYCIRD